MIAKQQQQQHQGKLTNTHIIVISNGESVADTGLDHKHRLL